MTSAEDRIAVYDRVINVKNGRHGSVRTLPEYPAGYAGVLYDVRPSKKHVKRSRLVYVHLSYLTKEDRARREEAEE